MQNMTAVGHFEWKDETKIKSVIRYFNVKILDVCVFKLAQIHVVEKKTNSVDSANSSGFSIAFILCLHSWSELQTSHSEAGITCHLTDEMEIY